MTDPEDSSENQLDEPSGGSGSRRVVDWLALAGFLAHWVFAIGAYVFYVLLMGLVGAMFGGFLDFAFVWVNRQWAGSGTQVGWVLGASLAAIGLPAGWVRPNDKKFSFASPGKLLENPDSPGKSTKISTPDNGPVGRGKSLVSYSNWLCLIQEES